MREFTDSLWAASVEGDIREAEALVRSLLEEAVKAEGERIGAEIIENLPDLSVHEGSHTSLRFWQGYRKGMEEAAKIARSHGEGV